MLGIPDARPSGSGGPLRGKEDAASHSLREGGNLRGAGLCDSAEIPSRKKKKNTPSRTQQNSSTHHKHHNKQGLTLTLTHSLSHSQVTHTRSAPHKSLWHVRPTRAVQLFLLCWLT